MDLVRSGEDMLGQEGAFEPMSVAVVQFELHFITICLLLRRVGHEKAVTSAASKRDEILKLVVLRDTDGGLVVGCGSDVNLD